MTFSKTAMWLGIAFLWASLAGAQNECPDGLLIQPDPHPANSAYPDPMVTGSCSGEDFIVNSNNIPGFEFQPITPGELQAQNFTWTIPINPTLPEEHRIIDEVLGTIAFTTTGLSIVGPIEGPVPPPQAFGDPIFNGIVDFCFGHVGGRNDYHNHALLLECIGGEAPDGEVSPILGYALDGFPIYGSEGCLDLECTEVVTFKSGWEQIGDPTSNAFEAYEYVDKDDPSYLDQCNGRIGPDGTYRYHATEGFPYVMGCFAGLDIVEDNGSGGGTDPTGIVEFAHPATITGESLGTTTVELVRTGGSEGSLTATVSRMGGTASGNDFNFNAQSVTWSNGEDGSRFIELSLVDDNDVEGSEELDLDLEVDAGPTNTGDQDSMVVKILDDDRGDGPCPEGDVHIVCLYSGGTSVEVEWVDFDGNFGHGTSAAYQTETSALFTFFSDDNIELLIKVLDGCTINGNRWILSAAATNVGYVFTVYDYDAGDSFQYENPITENSEALVDITALPDSCM